MIEPHVRLQEIRRKAGYETASDAARAFGWNENTYRSHENGERGLRPGVAARYASAFQASTGWLLTGEDAPPVGMYVSARIRARRIYGFGFKLRNELTTIDLENISIAPSIPYKVYFMHTTDYAPQFGPGDVVFVVNVVAKSVSIDKPYVCETSSSELFVATSRTHKGRILFQDPKHNLYEHDELISFGEVFAVLKKGYYEIEGIDLEALTRDL